VRRAARALLLAAVALVVFGGALSVLLPVDDMVRRAVLRNTPPGWPALVFQRAALWPTGIVLDDVTFRDPTGAEVLHAGRLTLRPSLLGLVRDGSGLPMRFVFDEICSGAGDATLASDGDGADVTVSFTRADLASCPPLAIAGGALTGRADGTARLRLAPGRVVEGEGTVAIARASWKGPNLFARLFTDSAAVRWRLTAGRLALEGIDVRAPSLAIYGAGEVRLAEPIDASALDLKLTMASAPGAAGNPLRVDGTLAQPEVHFK
jgi:type II secretion system protein N